MTGARTAARIALRELRGGVRGFRVFLACLALGVAAIASVGTVTSSVLSGLERGGAVLLGGDAALRMTHRDISPEQRAWLKRGADVSRVVHMQSMARGGPAGRRALVEIKMVDGAYPLYGKLETQPAFDPAFLARDGGAWGAVADPALLRRLGIGVGDVVRIGDASYRIRGEILQEPDRVSGGRPLQLGPRFIASAESVEDSGLVRPGSQVWYFYRVRLAEPNLLDGWKRELDAAFPDAQWIVRDRSNASPSIRRLVDRASLFMMLVGLVALLVGGVGVSNAVRDFLAGRMRTIATLKCVGASSAMIFGIYLIQIMAMAAVGIALGLAVGGLAPALAADLVRDVVPVAARVDIYAAPLLLAAAFGVLTALAFSVWPLARACELPAAALFRDAVVRARAFPRWPFMAVTAALLALLAALAVAASSNPVIAAWFVCGAAGAMLLFAAAARAVAWIARNLDGIGSMGARLALANLHRPGAPTGSVILSLGLGLTVLVTVALIEVNLSRQITRSLPERAPGYFFIDVQTDQIGEFRKIVGGAEGFRELRSTPMLRGRVTRLNGAAARPEDVHPEGRWILRGDRGVTWSRELPPDETVVAGQWWPADYGGPPLVSMSANSAAGLGLGIGDTITVNILGRNITARIASLRRVQWQTLRMNFLFIFSPGVLEGAPQTHLATIRADPVHERAIERAVADAFPNVTAIRVRDVLDTVNAFVARLGAAVRATAAVAIAAGVLVLAGTVAAAHRRRMYDSVILKVLGATRARIMGVLLLEYGLLGLFTAAVAAVIGSAAAWAVVTEVMRFSFRHDPEAVAVTVAISVAITLSLGLAGIWQALRQKAAPLLRNQ